MAKEEKIAKKEIIFLLILIAAVFAVRIPHMYDPLDTDEGVYAYAAARTYYGELPYKDVFDHKPPFIYYLYRAAFDLFGVTDTAVRNFTSIYVVFSVLLLYMFARTFAGAAAAMLAAFFYCLFLNNGIVEGFGSNTEVFTHFTVMFSLFFLLDREKTYEKAHFFLSGFLMAAAFFTKTMLVFACIVPVIYILNFIHEKKARLAAVLWYGGGFLTLILLAVLWAVKNNMLKEMLECNIGYNIFYVALREKTVGIGGAMDIMIYVAKNNLLLTAGFLYSAAAMVFKKESQVNFMFFMTAVSVLAGIVVLKGTYPHYYIAIIPFAAVSAAFMVKDALAAAMKIKSKSAAAVVAVLAVVFAGMFQGVYVTAISGRGKPAAEQELSLEARAFGRELKRISKDKASLFVWPNEAAIYFYSGIKARGRLINAFPYGYFSSAFGEFYSGLMLNPPDYFVIRKNVDEKVFENMVKTYYSKLMEGKMLVLYKKGGLQ